MSLKATIECSRGRTKIEEARFASLQILAAARETEIFEGFESGDAAVQTTSPGLRCTFVYVYLNGGQLERR